MGQIRVSTGPSPRHSEEGREAPGRVVSFIFPHSEELGNFSEQRTCPEIKLYVFEHEQRQVGL